jgi:hypothetical protein
MIDSGWYDLVEGAELLQGDLLSNCSILIPTEKPCWPLIPNSQIALEARKFDVIVMSQSCDLVNDKIEDVLLAQVITWSSTVRDESQKGNEGIKSSKFRKSLVEGGVPSLSLLHKRLDEPKLEWSVVDFRHLFIQPKAYVRSFAASLGPRLRLRSPYREHLAQAFARYFMRVGLPHDAKAFEKEGDR